MTGKPEKWEVQKCLAKRMLNQAKTLLQKTAAQQEMLKRQAKTRLHAHKRAKSLQENLQINKIFKANHEKGGVQNLFFF